MTPGSVLAGKYRLDAQLGRGAMGAVWRAWHLQLDAPVAVKLIDADPAAGYEAGSQEAHARFQREAKAAAALRSAHVVQIFDYGIDAATQTPFIVMELLEGESLAARLLRVGRLSLPETLRIVVHVARALTRAHNAGIVHRDLKPDNVFLVRNDDEDIAKVLDFGIAKSQAQSHALGTHAGTAAGAWLGTPYYMSPEQLRDSQKVDYRTDLWALAVLAYECLIGRRPFEAENLPSLTLQICGDPLPIPSQRGPVPPGFDAWFERGVSRDPNGRFRSAQELSEAFNAICTGAPFASAGSGPAASAHGPTPQPAPFAPTPAHVPAVPTPRPVPAVPTPGDSASLSDTKVVTFDPPRDFGVGTGSTQPLSRTRGPIETKTSTGGSWKIPAAAAIAVVAAIGVGFVLLQTAREDAKLEPSSAASEALPAAPSPVAVDPAPSPSSPPPIAEPAPLPPPAPAVVPSVALTPPEPSAAPQAPAAQAAPPPAAAASAKPASTSSKAAAAASKTPAAASKTAAAASKAVSAGAARSGSKASGSAAPPAASKPTVTIEQVTDQRK